MRKPFTFLHGGVADDWAVNLFWLRIFLLMHVASRTVLALRAPALDQPAWMEAVYFLLVAACLIGLVPRLTRYGMIAVALLLGVQIAGTMPITANHIFLEFLCVGLLALVHESRKEESELAIIALRWFVVILLFYSGLQKLIYGYYFDGQFLAYSTAMEDRFATFFRFFMTEEDFIRLREMDSAELGMGPYRVRSPLFVIISNCAWMFELGLPFLMAIRKTRVVATGAAIAFVIGIEAGARELLFGALTINLMLLFLPGRWIKKLFPVFALIYLYLVASEFEIVPMFRFYH
jgi:hypothetical protein